MIISPSLLSADFANLSSEISALEQANIKWLHLDIMDGCFVPNITFGFPLIKSIRKTTKLFFDVHLMINEPERYLADFKKAGADMLVVHAESTMHLQRTLSEIKNLGMQAGVALNPATSLSCLEYVLDYTDMILIMGVNPGFSGQSFLPATFKKIRTLREMLRANNVPNVKIQVDGGVDLNNAKDLVEAGADVLVSGSAFFKFPPYTERLQLFESAIAK